ncbi:MAG: FkbM family methyltransferase [Candidatus Paceibacterota bacterium]|jgi:FkbM family methyltransferase
MPNPIRKIFNKAGIDLHRYHPSADRLAWLSGLNIKTVFDTGANIGQFATEIRERLPFVQIYSFEPIKECYEKLIVNFANDKNFQAFNCALGEIEGLLNMNKSSYTPSSSLLAMADSHKQLFPHTKDNRSESISIRRLDEVSNEINVEKDILIKVDTQGYEDKVIAGGIKTFLQAKVAIMEASFIRLYEGQPLFDDIYEKMKSLGFTYNGALHQKINPKTGEVIFEDAIFVRNQ